MDPETMREREKIHEEIDQKHCIGKSEYQTKLEDLVRELKKEGYRESLIFSMVVEAWYRS